jgi:uncharacterized OB-fold protein
MPTCEICQGSGECQHDFHDHVHDDTTIGTFVDDFHGVKCPACGKGVFGGRGNCSECGGDGEV